jgi:hypothetical protein
MDDIVRLYPGLAPHALWPAALVARVKIFVVDVLVGLDEISFETHDPRCLTVIAGEDFRHAFRHAQYGCITRSHAPQGMRQRPTG